MGAPSEGAMHLKVEEAPLEGAKELRLLEVAPLEEASDLNLLEEAPSEGAEHLSAE